MSRTDLVLQFGKVKWLLAIGAELAQDLMEWL
jgi:hypothetical protein